MMSFPCLAFQDVICAACVAIVSLVRTVWCHQETPESAVSFRSLISPKETIEFRNGDFKVHFYPT